ncbi:MAG: hypothetical protein FD153_1591 [Rhodospirillaceae bacterium]|nr:MAG: hypothetical protein FD153_1591 [Rhodospirillaceae bacterium]
MKGQGIIMFMVRTSSRSFFGVGVVICAFATMDVSATPLPEAIEQALTTYPALAEAKADQRAQAYELKQQRGLYLPSLDILTANGPE